MSMTHRSFAGLCGLHPHLREVSLATRTRHWTNGPRQDPDARLMPNVAQPPATQRHEPTCGCRKAPAQRFESPPAGTRQRGRLWTLSCGRRFDSCQAHQRSAWSALSRSLPEGLIRSDVSERRTKPIVIFAPPAASLIGCHLNDLDAALDQLVHHDEQDLLRITVKLNEFRPIE